VYTSVIIPTYNRCNSLRETLLSLSGQSLSSDHFEVVVVSDGSTDETEGVARAGYSYSISFIHQANQGSAVARNTGASHACGDLLIFLDDDMLAQPDYLAGLVDEHTQFDRIVGMGQELPWLPPEPTTFARLAVDDRRAQVNRQAESEFVDFTACVTNNLSVLRSDFMEIGGMQDVAGDGPTWWGDVDFGYRAAQRGFRFRRSVRAKCVHCDYSIRGLATAACRAEKVAEMATALFRKHPGVETQLPMFQDKMPIDWSADPPRLVVRKAARRAASTAISLRLLTGCVRMLEQFCPNPVLLRPLYRWILGGYLYRGYRSGINDQAHRLVGRG
jgi:hypothetical protein